MKTTIYFLFGFIILSLFTSSLAQENEKPFIVSPLIGDTLSLEERDYYKLLPTIDNLQWAVFYLNSDSTLNAKVAFRKDGVLHDTLIINYRSLESLLNYLKMKSESGTNSQVTCYLINGNELRGNLLAVREKSLLIQNLGCEYNSYEEECVNLVRNSDIQKLKVKVDESNLVFWMGLGFGVGCVIGGIIGKAVEPSNPYSGLSIGFGALIGGLVGLGAGAIVEGVTSAPDVVMEPFSEDDIKGLSVYSRYPYEEPDELKKIK